MAEFQSFSAIIFKFENKIFAICFILIGIKTMQISNDNLLSLLKVFISEDKNYKYLNKEIIKMSEFCNIENIKNKIDKFYPEYTEEQVVKNFIEGYKQINNK